ncbi:MAG: FAD-binding oxidoreductase [Pseudomonadota bacterium]
MSGLDIGVVGAGIVGVSTAEWLRRDGHRVTLFDRHNPGSPDQTSFGNAGVLAGTALVPVPVPGLLKKAPKMLFDPLGPLHLRWSYLPRLIPWLIPFLKRATRADVERTAAGLSDICGDTLDQHRAISNGTPAEAFIDEGPYTYLYRTRADFAGDKLGNEIRDAYGLIPEEWDRARLEDEAPGLGPDYTFAAAFPGNGWVTSPGNYLAALFGYFQQNGGSFIQGEVADIRPTEGAAEVTCGETHCFDKVVLAGGAWSTKLAKRLGHDPGLEAERGYHIVFEGANRRPSCPLMVSDAKFVMTPMSQGLRCAGQVEFGGLEAGPSEAPYRLVHQRIRDLYPDLEWQQEHRWLGHRPSTIDSLPFIGPSPKAPQIHFAFGAQHVGLTTGPKTGRLIADLIGGRRPNIDLSPFAVGRFDHSRNERGTGPASP